MGTGNQDAKACSPLPCWFNNERVFGTLQANDSELRAQTLCGSFCVNAFWQSTKAGRQHTLLSSMQPLSLWDQLLQASKLARDQKRYRITKALPWPSIPVLGNAPLPSMPSPEVSDLRQQYRLLEKIGCGTYAKRFTEVKAKRH